MKTGVIILLIGGVVLGAVLGLFYLKDSLDSRRLARIAHSELTMRFAVIGAALIVIGILLLIGALIAS
jgi:hypothetical protein